LNALRRAAIAAFRPRPPRGAPSAEALDRTERLLIVRAHDQLGDFLLVTPALASLRARFPRARITLVVNRFLAPLAESQPDVDRILVAPWGGRGGGAAGAITAFARVLRAEPYDLALVLNTVAHSLSSDLVARLSGARYVVGPAKPELKDAAGAPLYDWAYNPATAVGAHQMHRALAVVTPLGAPPVPLCYRFALRDEERDAGARRRAALPSGPLVALHVGTKDAAKRYPTDLWIATAAGAARALGAHVVVLDAPDAGEATIALAGALGPSATRLTPMGLREVAAFLSCVDLLLCHDSAILHLAAAVGTPTVSVHGRGAVAEWKPPHERHVALQTADSIPGHVSPQEMIAACVRAIAVGRAAACAEAAGS
jgi:ADP-heptose:LPS heptosyltransferase